MAAFARLAALIKLEVVCDAVVDEATSEAAGLGGKYIKF